MIVSNRAFRKSGEIARMPIGPHHESAISRSGLGGGARRTATRHEVLQLDDLSLDLFQLGLDLGGIIDPTPIADGASALFSLARGMWLDAALSGVAAIVPYVGDLAKAGKLPRYLRSVERAIELAERTGQAGRLLPGIRQLERALTWFPAGASYGLDRIRDACRAFTARCGRRAVRIAERDVSKQFVGDIVRQGAYTRFWHKGRLGVPGRVRRNRGASRIKQRTGGSSVHNQRRLSRNSGSDAGHLFGDCFGGSGGYENLLRMTPELNRGAFARLERVWYDLLQKGHGVEVHIRGVHRSGELAPMALMVNWRQIRPDGRIIEHAHLPLMNSAVPELFAR